MELIPIFSTVLLISTMLFIVVLLFSFFSSKKVKNIDRQDYTEIVRQRRIAHSIEQQEYINKSQRNRETNYRNNSNDIKPNENNSERNFIKQRSTSYKSSQNPQLNYFNINSSRNIDGGPRYSILNEISKKGSHFISQGELRMLRPLDYTSSG